MSKRDKKFKKLMESEKFSTFIIGVVKVLAIAITFGIVVLDSQKYGEKPENIVFDVYNEDSDNIYKKTLNFSKKEYKLSERLNKKLDIRTNDFRLENFSGSVLIYDNRLKNYTEDYKDIINSNEKDINKKADLIYEDVLKENSNKDVLIVTTNKADIVGIFIANTKIIQHSSYSYVLDNQRLHVYNSGVAILSTKDDI